MANSKKRCTGCKQSFPSDLETRITKIPMWFHDADCLVKWHRGQEKKKLHKEISKKILNRGQPRKKAVTRSDLFQKLQSLVNQYVLHIRDAGKPCFTCGTTNDIQYHAGHRFHAGSGGGDRRRFMEINIHKQCVRCNNFKSGASAEYDARFIKVYGQEKLDWLKDLSQHPTLKEQFPTKQDIEKEIDRYRRLIRSNGLTPRV